MISLKEGAHQYIELYFNSFLKNYVSKNVLMRAHGNISSFWYLTKRITFVTHMSSPVVPVVWLLGPELRPE